MFSFALLRSNSEELSNAVCGSGDTSGSSQLSAEEGEDRHIVTTAIGGRDRNRKDTRSH